MSTYDNYSPIEFSTPTKSPPGTPVTTPSRAALVRHDFLARGSPIKFGLCTPEKTPLKDVELDEFEEPEKEVFSIRRAVFRVLLWLLWGLLMASSVYLSMLYIESAGLTVTRWSTSLKILFQLGLAVCTFATGFSIGYIVLDYLGFPSSPWRTSLDHVRRLTVNWVMFGIFLVCLPAICVIVPIVLGRSGKFNPETQAWNNACTDSQYTSMLHIKYISSIGYSYSMNMYARDTEGNYHYLGLLPSSGPAANNVKISPPTFILFPSTNPLNPASAAGKQFFTPLPNATTPQYIATLSINATATDGQSIQANCTTSQNQLNQTICVNGFLTSSAQLLANFGNGPNPILHSGNRTKTLEIMYDVESLNSNSTDSTFLRGFSGSWPNELTSFMTGDVAAQVAPSGVLEQFNSAGVSMGDGVDVVNSPWPGCDGLKVCGTTGLNAMIVSGWIWENLDQWKWYDKDVCYS